MYGRFGSVVVRQEKTLAADKNDRYPFMAAACIVSVVQGSIRIPLSKAANDVFSYCTRL